MNIHEFQAKEVFSRYGIPVPRGIVASTPAEAKAATEELGGQSVVKAQIHAGGRGKSGGVQLVRSPDEASAAEPSAEAQSEAEEMAAAADSTEAAVPDETGESTVSDSAEAPAEVTSGATDGAAAETFRE